MKYKDAKKMLRNPDNILAEDIAQYALFENDLNDNDKFRMLSDLIGAYGNALMNQGYERGINSLKEKPIDN